MANVIHRLLKRNFFFLSFLILSLLVVYVGQVDAEITSKTNNDKAGRAQQANESEISAIPSDQEAPHNDTNSTQTTKQLNQSSQKTAVTNKPTVNTYVAKGGESQYHQPSENITTLKIESSIASGSYPMEIVPGQTRAFEVLIAAGTKYGFSIGYTDFGGDLGKFITRIANIDTPTDYSYYWSLYYNGSPSFVGASSLILYTGDTVSWKYIKSDW